MPNTVMKSAHAAGAGVNSGAQRREQLRAFVARVIWTRMSFRLAALVLSTSIAASAAETTEPSQAEPAFRDSVVLVGFNTGVAREEQARVLASVGGRELRVIGQAVHVLHVAPGRVQQTIDALRQSPAVRYAEADFRHDLNAAPNDPSFPQQWALQNSGQLVKGIGGTAGADEGAVKVWDVTTGSRSIVVAVLDTGIDYNHPDLAANVWSNPGGINGCAAGTHGYNVLNATCDPMDDDTAYNGHGTHVAGIIGATTNNATGVAGVNWQVTLLGVKWVDASGHGYTSGLISGLDWVIQAKQAGTNIRVVNDSQTWSGTASSQALSDEIDALGTNDILFVTAAGNTAQNNDTTPRYPCVYDRPNQVCAAASDQNDRLWASSNYGKQTVQLAAPGVNIYSTLRNGAYGFVSGCSMSAAEVSGAAALVLSTGDRSTSALRSLLLSSVDVLPAFSSVTQTGGRLNICKAISGCSSTAPVNTALPTISENAAVGQQLTATNGSWSGSPTAFAYEWQRCDANGVNCSDIVAATSNTYGVSSTDVSSTLRVVVTASNSAGSTAATSNLTAVIQGAASGVSLVQKASAQGRSVSSVSVTFPNANSAGNTIIAFVRASTTGQTVTLSDNCGNTYVDAVQRKQTTDRHQVHIFYAANIAAGTNSVTATFSGTNNRPWIAVFEYSGLSAANPLDVTASAQGIDANPSSGNTAQTHSASELIFSGLGLPSSSSVTVNAGAGETILSQVPSSGASRGATEQQTVASTGVFAANYSLSAPANWSVVAATFVAESGAPLTISTTSLHDGTQESSYSATLNASGGVAPYSWSITGNLPPGLIYTPGGSISGTPTSSGTYNFTVQVQDARGNTANRTLSIQVNPATINPISLIQSASVEGTSVSSLSQSFPSANSAGNLIVAFVRMSTTSQTVQVTDTLGNVYADAISQAQASDGHQTHVFYARNIVAGANTVSGNFSASNGHPWLSVYEYSGLNTGAPLDATAHAQGSSASANSGFTAVTTSANKLVFAGVGLPANSAQTVRAGGDFVLQQQDPPPNHSRGATEDAIVNSAGQYAGTFDFSGSANWSAVVATFKP